LDSKSCMINVILKDMKNSDVFICHASEDKATFVKPLALRLKELSVRVWYDEFAIEVGDWLSEKIAEGLATCRHGLIVISPAFNGKPWTSYEISGLLNRFIEERLRLIPIWLGIDRSEVAAFNPSIADLKAIMGDPLKINEIAFEVLRIVRPTLSENIQMIGKINDPSFKSELKKMSIKDIKPGPIRHHDLSPALLMRIQNIHYAFREVLNISLEETIENFQRDLLPEKEIEIWEQIKSAETKTMDSLGTDDLGIRKQVVGFLLGFTSRESIDELVQKTANDDEARAILATTMEAWLSVVPDVTVSDVTVK
jgi:TIR domain